MFLSHDLTHYFNSINVVRAEAERHRLLLNLNRGANGSIKYKHYSTIFN